MKSKYRIRKQTMMWKQKRGVKIRICDMGDEHVINTVQMLERFAKARKHLEDEAVASCPFDGDTMAAYFWEGAMQEQFNTSWESYLPEIYYKMHLDLTRRRIYLDEETEDSN